MENYKRSIAKLTSGIEIFYISTGSGEPLLLLHGFPQTHLMWHKVAPVLAKHYTVIAADLRGYGNSSKPEPDADHSSYSKRSMAQDMLELMQHLGYSEFYVAGHDRGARVAHRLVLDHPNCIKKLALLDIVPTYTIFSQVNKEIAMQAYH